MDFLAAVFPRRPLGSAFSAFMITLLNDRKEDSRTVSESSKSDGARVPEVRGSILRAT